MSFGRIILGDNQFLGINHASPSKAAELSDRFAHTDAILEVIGWAYEAGIRDFMFTTHERLQPVLAEIARSRLFPDMQYIPCLPYAHKYANTMTEGGMKAVFTRHLGECSKSRLAASVAKLAIGRFSAVMELLLEIELLMCRGIAVKGVFLQNVIFDLLMGLRAHRLIEGFDREVRRRFGATPGYITMNHGLAQTLLCDEIGLSQPWVCTNFNAGGFRMHPSPEQVVQTFANGRSCNIAMSVFASGALSADAAVRFMQTARGVDSVLFGSSSQKNIVRNFEQLSRKP
ncbi:hypothetical protein [Aquabacterium sp. OR-4]|uniref:hypothetical protein n=1 Tax=Aquabacterium sp. OR-4 TaxID=2978127 RepID=UPI0028C8A8BD|nr:hypothetical protein [Aquabacterium sp. OR-4]MDT7834484.1 hypothetical protein [Aquabacterium sp. OR-4]